ncbi:MAG: NAD(P)/FAD-dependent oxidoreductase [Patescibacteria group bacterium]
MTQKIDNPNLDVIVIGAGPAGGSAARELAKRGRKVLLIERSQEIGEPNYSTAGTPKETVEEFNLPQEVLSATWDRILFATPRVEASWKYSETRGYVFDFAKLRKFLADDAANHGAEIMVGTNVTDLIEENGRIAGLRYHGALGDGEARAKIIIDASGHNEFTNAKLKINPVDEKLLGNAMEYVMTKIPEGLKTTLGFYIGSEYACRGYSWIFPMNDNRDAKVGTGVLGQLPEGGVERIQEKFIKSLPFFKNMEPTEIHAGAARISSIKHHVWKNIVLVGDAAHQINPLLGEGIRHCLKAGRLAAEIIDNWLSKSEMKNETLKTAYEKKWKANFGRSWRLSFMAALGLVNFNDKQFDAFVTGLQKISREDIFELIFHYKVGALLKYPGFIKDMAKTKLFKN